MARIHSRKIEEKNYDTILHEDVQVKGKLFFTKPVMIKCAVEGEITSDSEILIDADASVTANLAGGSIRVLGTVQGNLKATERVELEKTAKVSGSIDSPRVVMDDGSRFDGSNNMPFLGQDE